MRPPPRSSRIAGYAALVAYEKAEAELPASAKPAWHRQGLESGVHFAITFESHPESIAVLARAAREYYDLKDYAKAIEVADLVLARRPPVDPERQRIAWTCSEQRYECRAKPVFNS